MVQSSAIQHESIFSCQIGQIGEEVRKGHKVENVTKIAVF